MIDKEKQIRYLLGPLWLFIGISTLVIGNLVGIVGIVAGVAFSISGYLSFKEERKKTKIKIIETEAITESEKEWLNEAKQYAIKLWGENCAYLECFTEENIEAWREYIEDGYTPVDAVNEDISCAQ